MSVTEVAARAGVSIATVSRVLNRSRPVNPEIAERVLLAVSELGYSPRRSRQRRRARAMQTQGSTIAIVGLGQTYRGWIEAPMIGAFVGAITRAAQTQQMAVVMTEMPDPNELSPVLRRRDIAGAIVHIAGTMNSSAARVLARTVPTVGIMGGQLAPVDMDYVGVDNNAVGYVAGRYLAEHGCKRVGFISTAVNWAFLRMRAHGFVAAAYESGGHPELFVVSDPSRLAAVYGNSVVQCGELSSLLDAVAMAKPDGLFISRDEETVEVYRGLYSRGITPGKDIKVISCDNDSVRLSVLHPRPPSISLEPNYMAQLAVRRLQWRIKHPEAPPIRILVNPRLELGDKLLEPMIHGEVYDSI